MFPIFGKVNPKTGTPTEGTIITGLVSTVIALFFDLDSLVNMISIGTLLAFTVVCGGVVILRYQNPAEPKRSPLLVVSYVAACLFASIAERFWPQNAEYWVWTLCCIPLLVIFTILALSKQTSKEGIAFLCPLVPLGTQ